MSKVVIIVAGGLVQDVYATTEDIEVEVLDLDEPSYATKEEEKETKRRIRAAEKIIKSNKYKHVW